MSSNKILVPIDFTDVTIHAVKYAEKMASSMQSEIILLHIVDDQSKIDDARKKLADLAKKVNEDVSNEVKSIVRIGSIFEDIAEVAAEEKAMLVVMGTHGKRGLQKITGSWAMKVINNSKVPFLVVQEKPVPDSFKHLVFPVDLQSETKEKIGVTMNLAKELDATIHIFSRKSEDKFEQHDIDANLKVIKNFFKSNDVKHEVKFSELGEDFVDQLLHYAVSIDADMINIVNLNYKNFVSFIGNKCLF